MRICQEGKSSFEECTFRLDAAGQTIEMPLNLDFDPQLGLSNEASIGHYSEPLMMVRKRQPLYQQPPIAPKPPRPILPIMPVVAMGHLSTEKTRRLVHRRMRNRLEGQQLVEQSNAAIDWSMLNLAGNAQALGASAEMEGGARIGADPKQILRMNLQKKLRKKLVMRGLLPPNPTAEEAETAKRVLATAHEALGSTLIPDCQTSNAMAAWMMDPQVSLFDSYFVDPGLMGADRVREMHHMPRYTSKEPAHKRPRVVPLPHHLPPLLDIDGVDKGSALRHHYQLHERYEQQEHNQQQQEQQRQVSPSTASIGSNAMFLEDCRANLAVEIEQLLLSELDQAPGELTAEVFDQLFIAPTTAGGTSMPENVMYSQFEDLFA